MNNKSKREKPTRNFLLSLAQVMDYDPMFEMQKRVRDLENRIKDLERNHLSEIK